MEPILNFCFLKTIKAFLRPLTHLNLSYLFHSLTKAFVCIKIHEYLNTGTSCI